MMAKEMPKMKKLTTAQRDSLPASAFGDPAQRKYPIKVSSLPGFNKEQDIIYAKAARSRGGQQESMGNLSAAKQDKVDAKAKKMYKKRGFKTQAQKEASNKPKISAIDEYMRNK